MRVRDVITRSLDALVGAGALPSYPPRVRPPSAPPHPGSPFTADMLRTVALNDRSHPFYADAAAMQRAAAFIGAFKAAAAAVLPRPYTLPYCYGPLGAMPLADAHLHLEEALKSVGLRVTSHNAVNNSGSFELAEQTTIEKLPHFYGSWLSDRHGRDPWRDGVELRVAVDIKLAVVKTSAGRLERFAALALSAPAIALLQALEQRLGGTLPPGSPPGSTALIDHLARSWRSTP